MRIGTTFAAAAGLGLLGGCAVVDPRIAGGPEEGGYCMPETAGPTASGGSRGCPPGYRRLYGGYRNRVGTADHFDHAIALLRDRRQEMQQRDRDLAQLHAWSRIVTLGGLGTGVGATAFQANGTLVAASVLTGAAGYTIGTAFAPPATRMVLMAGIVALTCTETKAFSARVDRISGRIIPSTAVRGDRRRRASESVPNLQAQAAEARMRAAVVIGQADAIMRSAPSPDSPQAQVARSAAAAAQQLTNAADAVRTGDIRGTLIANAVYERTLSIVNEVNRQMMLATPDLNAIVSLARGSQGLAVNALADTRMATASANASLAVAGRTPQPAAPASAPALGGQTDAAAASSAPTDGSTHPPPAPTGSADGALGTAATAAAEAGRALLSALDDVTDDAVAQIAACSFEIQDGTADIALSPTTLQITATGPNASATAIASGGRGPYRVTQTGTQTAMRPATELSTGPIQILRGTAAANTTATFLVEDFGSRASRPVTLTVTAK